ncbi:MULTISPECIES: hypothetical protein [unclassified Saccharicrinis]|uniref:hypothetical protein n=1 Tax=unclassified Saccharicrinis TaxID=2646859 RepID=UPI003D34E670
MPAVTPPKDHMISNAETRAANLTSGKNSEIPATKQFVVNATGNLFVATTLNGVDTDHVTISNEAEEAFGQVSLFFAAMTKAMTEAGANLYDYDALDKLVSSSGLFVKVTQSNIRFISSQWGLTIGNQLIQTLFGLSGNLASIGKSLMDMIVGMGEESIKIESESSSKKTRVGTIVFVCEYLLGAVSITPIIISVDAKEAARIMKAGPCLSFENKRYEISIRKAVYLFVPPSFVKHAVSLNEAMSDPEFNNLVESIKSAISENEGGQPTPKPGGSGK